jgi:hypothetical protein
MAQLQQLFANLDSNQCTGVRISECPDERVFLGLANYAELCFKLFLVTKLVFGILKLQNFLKKGKKFQFFFQMFRKILKL